MPSLSDFFGKGTIGEQLLVWGVLNQLFGAALSPAISDIQQAVNALDPVLPLTPEQLAVGVVRGLLDAGNSQSEAAKSGIGPGRFTQLQELAQQPPALGLIIAAYQRSLGSAGAGGVELVNIDEALADLGISAQYRPLVKALAVEIPNPSEVLNAWLEGQITDTEARSRLLETGMDPTWIQTAYNANGQAPTPNELIELWNRGIIPEGGTGPDAISYDQGYLEGPFRNKWAEAYKALRFYLPPPREVTALLREGSITVAQATQFFQDRGLSPALTAIYLQAASHTATAHQRELTQAQVVALYEDKLVTHDQAHADLVALRFTPSDADLLLALADKKQAASAAKSAVTRLQNLYLAGTNSLTVTQSALHSLGLTDDNVSNLIATWNLEATTRVKELTEGQIVAAWFYGGFGANDSAAAIGTAVTRLGTLGYSQADALLLLTARFHSPITLAGVTP